MIFIIIRLLYLFDLTKRGPATRPLPDLPRPDCSAGKPLLPKEGGLRRDLMNRSGGDRSSCLMPRSGSGGRGGV
jgi:hypothetical protein